MLQECKLAMALTSNAYDAELCELMEAGAKDLELAGVQLPGTVSFVTTQQGIQDNSTLTDALVKRAIITYARVNFRSPDDYERLARSYENQKAQLMHATGYTDYGEPEPEPEPDPEPETEPEEGEGDGES